MLHHHVFTICFLVSLTKLTPTESQEITEKSAIFRVFPDDNRWKNAKIDDQKKKLMVSEYSVSSFDEYCLNDVKIEPIYYIPGETIELSCKMCDFALIFNGKPKKWAMVADINDFLAKIKEIGTSKGPKIEYVRNFGDNEQLQLPKPIYRQKNGTLISALSQGVYFCFDSKSAEAGVQRYFYVLTPFLPPVKFPIKGVDYKAASDNCATTSRIYPFHHWKSKNFELAKFDDRETCVKRNGHDDWDCLKMDITTPTPSCPSPSSCSVKFTDDFLPPGLFLRVSLQWSEWSECRDNSRYRFGECVLSLDKPLSPNITLATKWDWLKKLNQLTTNTVAFRQGLPLYSGLLATWLYDVQTLRACNDEDIGANRMAGYDEFMEDVFTKVFNVTDQEPTNAFRFCVRQGDMAGGVKALVGTKTEDIMSC